MTTKDSVLLAIKQQGSITANDLVNMVVGNYLNISSARAALSRTLKNLNALGMIERDKNRIKLTEKGLFELNKEMKNKLILRLNDTVSAENEENIEASIKLLATLLERSKIDADLLKVSKDSCTFHVSDIERMHEALAKKVEHFNYLSGVLSKHIDSLKELDFPNKVELKLDQEGLMKLSKLFAQENAQELLIECDDSIKPIVQDELKAELKNQQLFLPKEKFYLLVNFFNRWIVQGIKSKEIIKIIFSGITVGMVEDRMVFTGPYHKLAGLV